MADSESIFKKKDGSSSYLLNFIIVVISFFVLWLIYYLSGGPVVPAIVFVFAVVGYGLYKFVTDSRGHSFWTGFWIWQGLGPLIDTLIPIVEFLFRLIGEIGRAL